MRFGYARVSSQGQSLDIQIEDLNRHACEIIRTEKASGSSTDGRPELRTLLEFMREGDELLVTRVDRLARSTLDLCEIVAHLEKKGCSLSCTQQPVETRSPMGRLMVQVLAVFAEFELGIRRERQMAGIEKAKAEGRYQRGRPRLDYPMIRHEVMSNPNEPRAAIARRLGIGKKSLYRALAAAPVEASS
jgi:DNA invertase Pin-like site-specific DNA recombinase